MDMIPGLIYELNVTSFNYFILSACLFEKCSESYERLLICLLDGKKIVMKNAIFKAI